MKKVVFCLLLLTAILCYGFSACAEELQAAENVSDACEYTISFKASRAIASLKDDDTETYQKFKAGAFVTVAWDADAAAENLYLQWTTLPESYVLKQFDMDGKALSDEERVPYLYNEFIALEAGTEKIEISSAGGMSLTT